MFKKFRDKLLPKRLDWQQQQQQSPTSSTASSNEGNATSVSASAASPSSASCPFSPPPPMSGAPPAKGCSPPAGGGGGGAYAGIRRQRSFTKSTDGNTSNHHTTPVLRENGQHNPSATAHFPPSTSGGALLPTSASGASSSGVSESSPKHTNALLVTKEDFTVIKTIGQGSFAKVLLVQKLENGKYYAMKVVDKASMLDSGRVRDLFSERSVLKRAKHPFIVKLDYTFQSEHQLFFVMEYLEGGDMMGFLDRIPGKRLTEEQTRFYAAEVFLALQYLHDHGVIYRDLKPSNILLDELGHVCLADMGLCKVFDCDSDDIDRRCTSFVGSPAYVAPDVLRRKQYGSSVDWWSFGILVYRMLCGTVPFYGSNVRQIFDSIMFMAPDFQSYPWLSPDARSLLYRLLQKDERVRLCGNAIREHPFFAGVDWTDIYAKRYPPPLHFVPPHRLMLFPGGSEGPGLSKESVVAQPSNPIEILSPTHSIDSSEQEMFAGFTYVADGNLSRCPSALFDEEHTDDEAPPSVATMTKPSGGSKMDLASVVGSVSPAASSGSTGQVSGPEDEGVGGGGGMFRLEDGDEEQYERQLRRALAATAPTTMAPVIPKASIPIAPGLSRPCLYPSSASTSTTTASSPGSAFILTPSAVTLGFKPPNHPHFTTTTNNTNNYSRPTSGGVTTMLSSTPPTTFLPSAGGGQSTEAGPYPGSASSSSSSGQQQQHRFSCEGWYGIVH